MPEWNCKHSEAHVSLHIGRERLGEHPLARALFDPVRAKFYSKDAKNSNIWCCRAQISPMKAIRHKRLRLYRGKWHSEQEEITLYSNHSSRLPLFPILCSIIKQKVKKKKPWLTCCSWFRAKQAHDTENWTINTSKRIIMYWESKLSIFLEIFRIT